MNWKHSLYEICATTFGQAFTLDEAIRLLYEHREDRLFSIASAFAESKRAEAKSVNSKAVIQDFHESRDTKGNFLQAEAFRLETRARFIIAQPCLDMARVELEFIDLLLSKFTHDRTPGESALAFQQVQPYEFAFDYLWSMLYDGANSDLMRNVYANPYHKEILTVYNGAQSSEKTADLSRSSVSQSLAELLNLSTGQLAVSVNIEEQLALAASLESLQKYADSSAVAFQKLQGVSHDNSFDVPAVGAPSA